MFNTPILYIIFNRLDTVQQTFPVIKKQKPKYLYIAADGARKDKEGELEKCQQVRDWVLAQIDWDCDVKTLFRNENLGCGKGPAEAITWFFNNVEQGIILEDDCLPSDSFFKYCEELLEYYKDDERIWHIAGYNCKGIHKNKLFSYSYTAIQPVWGWATWKNRWKKNYYQIKKNEINDLDSHIYFRFNYRKKYWYKIFSEDLDKICAWDYQWTFCILKNNGFCCVPMLNQIKNIGWGIDSTHFQNSNGEKFILPTYELSTITHPKRIEYDKKLIKYTDKVVFNLEADSYFTFVVKGLFIKFPKFILKKLGLFDFVKAKLKH